MAPPHLMPNSPAPLSRPPSRLRALLLKPTVVAGGAAALGLLGLVALMGLAPPDTGDSDAALDSLKEACLGGKGEACHKLGTLMSEGARRDPSEAARWFDRGCRADDAASCFNMGYVLETGLGRPTDKARAADLYQKACVAHETAACHHLAEQHASGQGVEKDLGQAALLYQRACQGGHTASCNALAMAYARGHGVEADEHKAARLYDKSCDAGSELGCSNLRYLRHKGVQPKP